MPLERFIPKSPDPNIRNSQDFEVAKFGHLNTIIEYVNTYVVTDSLQLDGTGPLTSTARYITDSLGNASSLAISTGNIGIGTTNATARLRVISADTNGIAEFFQNGNTAAPLHLTRYGGNVPINLNTSGGTSTSPVPVGDNIQMSRITTNTYNGTAFGTSARIEVLSKGIQSATNYGSIMRFLTTPENATSMNEVMSLTSDGNVQIGIGYLVAGGAKLAIKGSGSTSATSSLLVQNSGGLVALEVLDDSRVKLGNSSDFTVYSGAGVVSRFAMNVGSTSLPTAQLQVKGSGSTSATTSLLVQNSLGHNNLKITDDGAVKIQNDLYLSKFIIGWPDGSESLIFDTTQIRSGGGNPLSLIGYSTNIGSGLGTRLTTSNSGTTIYGSGSTSATSSLLVQNSSGIRLLEQKDNGWLYIGNTASDTGVIYVPHSPTYADRVFMRIDGGFPLFSTISNALLEISCAQFYTQGDMTLRNANTGIRGGTASNINNSSIQLSTQVNAYNGTSQNDACSLVYIENRGATLQAAGSINWIKMDGNVYEAGGGGNKWCTGIYYNPSFTGGTLLANSHYCYHATSGQMMVNTTSPNASAQLQVDSTTRGFLPPRMTTAQRTAIVSPAAGLIVYDTDTNKSYTYDGTAWQAHY